MTIAAGFRCHDGIVLAVDSQYTGGIGKTSGQKIFPLWQTKHYSVTLASAGSVAMAKRTVQVFTKLVNEGIGAKPATLDQFQGFLEDALCEVHAKHIYPAPVNERAIVDYWLLMAAWTPEGFKLFRTDITAVTEVQSTACIGIGSYLGSYLTELLCHQGPLMAVEDTKAIAAYIIDSAKTFVDGCGLSTFIRVLTDKGIDERIGKDEISDAEQFFDSLFRSMRLCVEGAINVNYPAPGALDHLSASIKLFAEEFRKNQSKRKELVEARRREMARFEQKRLEQQLKAINPEETPSPPLTKADQ